MRLRYALPLALLAACSEPGVDGAESAETSAPPICSDRDEGCACDIEAQELPCYAEPRYDGGDMICNIGRQRCVDGRWGACRNMEEQRTNLAGALISPPDECNACNPLCFVATDDSIETDDLTPDNSDSVTINPDGTGGIITEDVTEEEDRTIGVGGDEPFDPTSNPAEDVELDTDGSIILGSSGQVDDSIWIANTGQGTISRFDIRTFAETGRFWAGPFGGGNDPSRTSINTAGAAYVAGRNGRFVTKISPLGEDCPDSNGDGVITTSTNGTALAWGQDDCVLWTTLTNGFFPGGLIRAVAAQDIVDPVSGDVREFVWVGGYRDNRIALLNGETGAVVLTTDVGRGPYGFALDGSGQLWISTISSQVVRVDTTRCNADVGCPAAAPCIAPDGESTACDGAVKARIPVPGSSRRTYGVTVDFRQRVWFGGNNDVHRFVPTDPPGSRWRHAGIGSAGSWKAGIAADARGNVWTTGSFGVWRLDADNPTNRHQIVSNAASQNMRGWGVAVAADDRTWVIGRWENFAWVVEPGAALTDNTIVRTANTVRSPYTYSDMTGQQLRLAATPRGTYVSTFEGCGGGTRWDSLTFDVETPGPTSVAFRIRTADTRAALNSAPWRGVGIVPSATSPLDVASVLDLAGDTHGNFAQVEIALDAATLDPTMFVTPRVRSVNLNYECATPTTGFYERVFDSLTTCMVPPTRPYWNEFTYNVDTPGDSAVRFEVAVAETEADLATAPEVSFTVPPSPNTDTVNLQALLASEGLPSTPLLLRVRAILNPTLPVTESAILRSITTEWECRPDE
ncbi:MAG: hypothetical protein AAF411_10055 [Myxococcota bacterium]